MDELLSTEGSADDISSDLLAFLHYVKSSTDETASRLNNDLVYKIHNRVTYIRQNRQMEVEYLKFEELMRESRADGFSEGRELGISEGIAALIKVLSDMKLCKEQIISKLEERFSLTEERAAAYYDEYAEKQN